MRQQELTISYDAEERIINIVSINKQINVHTEDFSSVLSVIGQVLHCLISINRNRELVAKTTELDKLREFVTADNIVILTEKPLTADMKVIDTILAIPTNIIVENKMGEDTHTVQLIQLVCITEPRDVTLMSFVINLLNLVL